MPPAPAPASIVELGTAAKRGFSRRVRCLARTARSRRSADLMAFGFGLLIGLSLTGWSTLALSTGVDPSGTGLLIVVGLGLFGFSSRGLWTVWTAACQSMTRSTR